MTNPERRRCGESWGPCLAGRSRFGKSQGLIRPGDASDGNRTSPVMILTLGAIAAWIPRPVSVPVCIASHGAVSCALQAGSETFLAKTWLAQSSSGIPQKADAFLAGI